MTCPNCGRLVAPGASCCTGAGPADAWAGPPADGYTVPMFGAALPIAAMHPLRTPAFAASAAVGLSALASIGGAALVLAGLDAARLVG